MAPSPTTGVTVELPVSSSFDLPGELLEEGLLDPPHCPGQVASIGPYEILRELGRGGMGIVLLARRTASPTASAGSGPNPRLLSRFGDGRLSETRMPGATTGIDWHSRERSEGWRRATSSTGPGACEAPGPHAGREDPRLPESRAGSEAGAAEETFAVKVLRPDCLRRRRTFDRFLAEARHMRQLDHPNIMKVLEVSDHPDRPYFAMPYFERGSLAALLRRGEPLGDTDLLRMAIQLAEALCYTHTKGIIHRDLKAANVLLSAEGDVFLGDFGLARTVFNDSIADIHHEHGEGTLPYMSPAVARGEAEDTRCDIYSFGALLYEALTRRPPYTGHDAAEIRSRILVGSPRPIHTLNPEASPGLALVAQWAMARELRDRYAQMSDVLADLQRLQKGQPPRGPHEHLEQPPHAHRSFLPSAPRPRTQRRQITRLTLGACLVALLVGGLAYGSKWISLEGRVSSSGNRVAAPNDLPRILPSAGPGAPEEPLFLAQAGCLLALQRPASSSATAAGIPDSSDPPNLAPLRSFRFHALPEFTKLSPEEWPELAALRLADFDRDGRRELFARAGAAGAAGFRGLYCFDYESAALRWRIVTGPAIQDVLFADLENDRSVEVIVGTVASGQGHVGQDHAADDCSYLYVLNRNGGIRWRTACGGTWTQVRPLCADLDADGRPELLAWVEPLETGESRGRPENRSRIALLNPAGQVTRVFDATGRLWDCQAADLDQDQRMELLAVDDSGQLHVFGQGLQPRVRLQLVPSPRRPVRLLLHTLGDVNRDGNPEIILSASQPADPTLRGRTAVPRSQQLWENHELIVLRRDFHLLARIPVEVSAPDRTVPRVSLVELTANGNPGLLWQAGQTRVYEFP